MSIGDSPATSLRSRDVTGSIEKCYVDRKGDRREEEKCYVDRKGDRRGRKVLVGDSIATNLNHRTDSTL